MKLIKYATICFIIVIIIHLLLSSIIVYAHSGNTDSNGGHYNRSTGGYHYHHGYPAHQHNNGICPYNFKDKINDNNNLSSSKKSNPNNNSNNSELSLADIFISFLISTFFGWICSFICSHIIFLLFPQISDSNKNKLYLILTIIFSILIATCFINNVT